MPKDITGHPALTAADLDRMTPQERQAAFDDRVVTDLGELPAGYLAQLQSRAAALITRAMSRTLPVGTCRTPRDLTA